VDPAIFKGRYPASGRISKHSDVIVRIDDDPLQYPGHDDRWSCCIDVRSLDEL
jgi:hypothetical protein